MFKSIYARIKRFHNKKLGEVRKKKKEYFKLIEGTVNKMLKSQFDYIISVLNYIKMK